jgi:hypothetical protein
MKNCILILSSVYDFSTDLVVQRLEKEGENYLRLNKEHLSLYEISLDPINQILDIKRDNININLHISKIKSIWFRQAIFLRNISGNVIDINEQLSKSQWNAFLRGLIVFDSAFWMNKPEATYSAESKPYQLMMAKKSGFIVPQTIISNTLGFKKLISKDFIVKSLDTVFLRESNDCYFTYTSKVSPDDFSLSTTKDAPITFQEYIGNKLDIRVTVIKNKVYAVSITSNGLPIEDDWRLVSKELLEYNDIILPENLKKMCVGYLKELGLVFGCIDFIKSNSEYVFIEINPTGEWGWLANYERQIDGEIAKNLIIGNKQP